MLTVGSLFSGIGGLDLGFERAGMTILWQAESDPYCRAVLKKHWPDVPCYHDVREINAKTPKVDVLVGGFPCQPVSVAGRRKAEADPRWLWKEFARAIVILRPQCVVVENVPGLLTRGMGRVLSSLSEIGYDAEWDCIPAAAVGAPHFRYRVFIVAYAIGSQLWDQSRWGDGSRRQSETGPRDDGAAEPLAHADRVRELQSGGCFETERGRLGDCGWWESEPDVGRVAHGVPARVDRLRTLGNAVVPQVAEWIGRSIMGKITP